MIPKTVWALGFVSLFMDVSSEMVHSLLPLFLVSVLGATALRVGFMEGVAESTAMIVKLFSGALSDWMRNRKTLTLIGYGLGAATKPLFAVAPNVGWVFTARFVDRVGKGIRGAPRDALIADVTDPEIRGAAFGLRQSLDTVGAFLGPILALVLMKTLSGNFRLIFWIAAIPGFFAVILLAVFVREPKNSILESKDVEKKVPPVLIDKALLGQLNTTFWRVVVFGSLLSLARFSEAFLLLKGPLAGIKIEDAPILMVVMNLAYVLIAYPVGKLSDRIGRKGLMAIGVAILVTADLVLAKSTLPWQVMLGVSLWGLQMGVTQGLLSAMIADSAPVALRGTAFGIFNLVSGLATLMASILAGFAWERFGAPATFFSGAILASGALVYYLVSSNAKMVFQIK